MTEATETAQYSVLCGRKALHYPDVSARALRAGRVMMIMMKNRQFWGCFASGYIVIIPPELVFSLRGVFSDHKAQHCRVSATEKVALSRGTVKGRFFSKSANAVRGTMDGAYIRRVLPLSELFLT